VNLIMMMIFKLCVLNGANRKRLSSVQYWKSSSILERFKGYLFDLIGICGPHWRKCQTQFKLLDYFAINSHDESKWMIRSGILLHLLDIYLRDTSVHIPQTSITQRKNDIASYSNHPSIGNRRKKSNRKVMLSSLVVPKSQIPTRSMKYLILQSQKSSQSPSRVQVNHRCEAHT
jgi:hypothetical protein